MLTYPWASFPFLRYVFFLVCGIVCYEYARPTLLLGSIVLSSGLCLFWFMVFMARIRSNLSKRLLIGTSVCTFLFGLGMVLSWFKSEVNSPIHFSKFKNATLYKINLIDEPIEKNQFNRVKAKVLYVRSDKKWLPVIGNLQVYFFKDSVEKFDLKYGDELIINAIPVSFKPAMNPDEFDYKQFLSFQQVFHQAYLRSHQFVKMGHQEANFIYGWALKARRAGEAVFLKFIPGRQEYAIASALVFGIKDALDTELKASYTAAGATHILAVSGMHVGLIFSVFLLLYQKLAKRKDKYPWGFTVLVILFLWFYAFMTGLSASVLRAVTMFTVMILGRTLEKNSNIFNTIALSAFILLCLDPFLVFDVGFQLSYAAVAGIVYIQPKIYRLLNFDATIPDWIWNVICVTIAAQIATAPVSLYYFHQFPNYFLFSNLLAIPISTVALYAGIALIAFNWVPYLGIGLGYFTFGCIWLMNWIIKITESLPFSLTQNVAMTLPESFLLFGFLVFLILFFSQKRLFWLRPAFICCFLFAGFRIFNLVLSSKNNFIRIYHLPGHSAISLVQGRNAHFVLSESLAGNALKFNYHFNQHITNLRLSQYKLDRFHNSSRQTIQAFQMGEKKVYYLNGVFPKRTQLPHFEKQSIVIIGKDCWIRPEILTEQFQTNTIVLEGNNNKILKSRFWKPHLNQLNHWALEENGSLKIEL